MKVLAIDVGGTHVKILASGQKTPQKFESGPRMTPKQMVAGVRKLTAGWNYDVVSIGFPALVVRGRIVHEPFNLGPGWVDFNFEKAFRRPVKLLNDAAMQAVGSYKGGRMLFLGLGTGLGSAMIADGILEPMELGHLPYRKGTYEHYLGTAGLKRHGKAKWRDWVEDVVKRLTAALEPDDVVLGGGNVKYLKALPKGCRPGNNANAFLGGFKLWRKGESYENPVHRSTHHIAHQAAESPS
jgi:polyphosphate glucokinase